MTTTSTADGFSKPIKNANGSLVRKKGQARWPVGRRFRAGLRVPESNPGDPGRQGEYVWKGGRSSRLSTIPPCRSPIAERRTLRPSTMAPGGRCGRCNQDLRGFGERATRPASPGRRLVSRKTSGSKRLPSPAGQACRYHDRRVNPPSLGVITYKTVVFQLLVGNRGAGSRGMNRPSNPKIEIGVLRPPQVASSVSLRQE